LAHIARINFCIFCGEYKNLREFKILLEELEKLGYEWGSGDTPTSLYERYKETSSYFNHLKLFRERKFFTFNYPLINPENLKIVTLDEFIEEFVSDMD